MPGFPLHGEKKDRHGSVDVNPVEKPPWSLGSVTAQSWQLGSTLRKNKDTDSERTNTVGRCSDFKRKRKRLNRECPAVLVLLETSYAHMWYYSHAALLG